jgi:hypothetical protein
MRLCSTWTGCPKSLPGLVSDEALRLDLESEPFRDLATPEIVTRSRGSWKLGFGALYYGL